MRIYQESDRKPSRNKVEVCQPQILREKLMLPWGAPCLGHHYLYHTALQPEEANMPSKTELYTTPLIHRIQR